MNLKISIAICLGFMLLFVVTAIPQFRCDYIYDASTRTFFKYHEVPDTFKDAQLRCFMEGATLASPMDIQVKAVMTGYLKTYQTERIFTGISAQFSNSDFHSVEGVSLKKIAHAWAPRESNIFLGDKQCLALDVAGKLSQVVCGNPLPYVCYKKRDSSLDFNACGTVDPEYSLDSRTGVCYKFHRVGRTWKRAYMACLAEGASLTTIKSEEEAQVLSDVMLQNPVEKLTPITSDLNLIYIGYKDWHEEGSWRDVYGNSLQSSGYEKWSPGKPEYNSTGEFCLGIYRNVLLTNVLCNSVQPFICKKIPSYHYPCGQTEEDYDDEYFMKPLKAPSGSSNGNLDEEVNRIRVTDKSDIRSGQESDYDSDRYVSSYNDTFQIYVSLEDK